ncbi:hypothetical protein [Methanosphaera sp. WGK6]|uniref:hypothetical protein n=1 Tax=Methanosphaera sp. WGK6 TaxID=1561964 RepID=UPI00084C9964|nr:hypothetical protein [Methanosphaera sp. WGK6]
MKKKKDKRFDKLINDAINSKFIIIKEIEINTPAQYINKELKRGTYTKYHIGKGESAALSLAIANNGTLASNNTRDVIEIVTKFKIDWVTTGDILIEAYHKRIITEEA